VLAEEHRQLKRRSGPIVDREPVIDRVDRIRIDRIFLRDRYPIEVAHEGIEVAHEGDDEPPGIGPLRFLERIDPLLKPLPLNSERELRIGHVLPLERLRIGLRSTSKTKELDDARSVGGERDEQALHHPAILREDVISEGSYDLDVPARGVMTSMSVIPSCS